MLQIPEAAQWLPQNTPAMLEARGPLMLPEVARQLGLTETQVVEAVVRVRGERMELYLNGRAIEVPPGWRMTAGQTVWLTAHGTTQGLLVLRQHASQKIAERALQAAASKSAASASSATSSATSTKTPSGPASTAGSAPVVTDPAREAALERVARAKVVLQARIDGQDPIQALAKQSAAQSRPMAAVVTPGAPSLVPATLGLTPRAAQGGDVKLMSAQDALQSQHPVRNLASSTMPETQLAGRPAAPTLGAHAAAVSAYAPSDAVPERSLVSFTGATALSGLSEKTPAHAALVGGANSAVAAMELIDWQQASPRVRELLAHPPGMQAVMQLFQPQVMAVLLQNPALAQWAQNIFQSRLSMRRPDPELIQKTVASALHPMESMLAKGQTHPSGAPSHDVRALLGDLLRLLREQGDGRAALVRAALSDVESAQVDHLRALQQREWSFQCVLPFADAPPVHLELQRREAEQNADGTWTHKWWVSLFTESEDLGRVWMRSGVSQGAQVEMQVWATQAHVVSDARARVDDLRDLLAEADLELSHFVVTHGEKPVGVKRPAPAHGAVWDQEA